ncbi:MAG TPA: DUF4440 domain-containing protein [Alphaproteobacteria bacterium]|nr:DUF4440 domain-containing protein [Alphaproteobacteria bacterium]
MRRVSMALVMLATIAAPAAADDRSDVAAVLMKYQKAIERLDAEGASPLFARDSRILEQGGDEGDWSNYLTHHLKLEFDEFSAFKFSGYTVDITIHGDLAVASERYRYDLVLKKDGSKVPRLGVASAVLKRTPEGWKIIQHHSSSRKPPEPAKP